MASRRSASVSLTELQALAEFRHQLRRFLHFSEEAAAKLDLQSQQHQLLLQIAGAPDAVTPTVGYVADRLGLRHNTAVELSKRSEEAGLISRTHTDTDRRCVVLDLTTKGRNLLHALSIDHARELNELAPQLIETLSALKGTHQSDKGSASRTQS